MIKEDRDYRDLFDGVIASTLRRALGIAAADPALTVAGAKILYRQQRAAAIRREYERQGILVPPVMMISLTSRCNLACKGCYMRAQRREGAPDMSTEQLRSLVAQASEMGVSVIVFAGGEPLLRAEEILDLAGESPRVLFVVFTNGLLIDDRLADRLAARRNLVPVISLEGFRADTDGRRGEGIYDRLLSAASMLKDRKVFFGCSITVTQKNIDRVTDAGFVRQTMETGARAFVFVEYVPIEPDTEDLVLRDDQRVALNERLAAFDREYPALFIGFPGDEGMYGGCLASGRGFVHVNPAGGLEPCPAAPFSDADLTKTALKDALRSGLLKEIREHHDRLTEAHGGCALWTNREWVRGLMTEGARERAP